MAVLFSWFFYRKLFNETTDLLGKHLIQKQIVYYNFLAQL